MVSGTALYGVFVTLLIPALGAPQLEETTVPSVCDPLMPLSVYEGFDALKSACVCSANAQRESCYKRTFDANDMEGYFLCEVRNCQNLNLCELAVPCAQTVVPGISIVDCGLTDHDYPELSTKSWLYDPVANTDALGCVINVAVNLKGSDTVQFLKGLADAAAGLMSSVNKIVIGSTP